LEAPEIISGEASVYREGRSVHSWQLTPSQVADVNAWLAKQREGWSPTITTHAPQFLYQLKARDGSVWTLNVSPRSVVVNGRHQFRKDFGECELALLGVKTMIKCP
jgi:hypothetical protein